MTPPFKQELLRGIPSVGSLLETQRVQEWLREHPRELVVRCVREAIDALRSAILSDEAGRCGPAHVTSEAVLQRAEEELRHRTRPHLRGAVNATGIILHTALGRAVWPESVVDSMVGDLHGYVTLAVDRKTGKRSERDQRIEYLLCELTGAEAGVVVNNNAAATLLVLMALSEGREVIVSRGQCIEIGGSFRLPDVMARSGATMVEVGTTNRTHLKDYRHAIGEQTGAIFRAHPSNFRVVGFTKEVSLAELVELAHSAGVWMIDDLGAGALVDLERFGLPHEPTMGESIADGADVVLASADKLIGASQGGVIVGRREAIDRIRTHPLYRALRVDKTCLMALERTLMLFRDPDRLAEMHPLYRMLAVDDETLLRRAKRLREAILRCAPGVDAHVVETVGYLGSGSLPMEQLPSRAVALRSDGHSAEQLAEALRLDEACVFSRTERETVLLDVRTLWDAQVEVVAEAVGRAVA